MIDADRQRGALIGLAVGDALGAAVEFMPPGTFEPVIGYRAGGPHGLAAGEWTDDTSMALALADSIASVGWDLNDQARALCRLVAGRRLFRHRPLLRHRHDHSRQPVQLSAMPRRPPVGRSFAAGQRQRLDHAAGARADRLCGVAFPNGSRNCSTRLSRVEPSRRMPARSAAGPARISDWC